MVDQRADLNWGHRSDVISIGLPITKGSCAQAHATEVVPQSEIKSGQRVVPFLSTMFNK